MPFIRADASSAHFPGVANVELDAKGERVELYVRAALPPERRRAWGDQEPYVFLSLTSEQARALSSRLYAASVYVATAELQRVSLVKVA